MKGEASSSIGLSVAGFALIGVGLVAISEPAQGAIAQRTVFLQASTPVGAGLNVTWDPGSQQYYAAGTGSGEPMYAPVFTYAASGALVDEFPAFVEHDLRSINYNSNTNKLELMTFNARDGGIGAVGGREQGLFEAVRDASGLPTGATSVLLGSLPANLGRQTMPVYDAGRNQFYSFSNSTVRWCLPGMRLRSCDCSGFRGLRGGTRFELRRLDSGLRLPNTTCHTAA